MNPVFTDHSLTLNTTVHWSLAFSLALLWFAAAWYKLRDSAGFQAALAAYQLLPPAAVRYLAHSIPWLEALLAVSLLLPGAQGIAAGASAIVLVLHGMAMAINLLRGAVGIDCGCGGGRAQPISWRLVIRNLLLACLSLVLLVSKNSTGVTLSQLITAMVIAAVLSLIYVGIGSVLRERQASEMEIDQ